MKTTENNNFETFSVEAVEEFIEKKTYEQIKKTSRYLAIVSSTILSLLAAVFQTGSPSPIYVFMFFMTASLVIFNITFFVVGYTVIFSLLKNRYMSRLSIIEQKQIITDKIEKDLLSCKKNIADTLKEQKELDTYLVEENNKQKILSDYLTKLNQLSL